MQIVRSFKLLCASCIVSLAASEPVPSLAKDRFDAEDRAHWAFQKVIRPAVPKVQHSDWVRNPIDGFILAELEKNKIDPAPRANKETLIRRAYLDLVGIPPSPREVDTFVADR